MPDSARNRVQEVISELEDTVSGNDELHLDLVNNLWLRDRARQIGEKALRYSRVRMKSLVNYVDYRCS